MKRISIKLLAISMAIVLGIVTLLQNTTYAMSNQDFVEQNLESKLQDSLDEENINIENLDITSESLRMDISIKTIDEEKIETTIEIEPGSENMTLICEEFDENGKIIEKEYEVSVSELNRDGIDATFIDTKTSEEYMYNPEDGIASFVAAIPIGIEIGVAAWALLCEVGKVILVAGSAYVIATSAKKSNKYNHFEAKLSGGGLYIGKGISKNQAISRMKLKQDVWSKTSESARQVAAGANTKGYPINEVDKENGRPKRGYYWHWHPYMRTPKAHSFYGNPVI